MYANKIWCKTGKSLKLEDVEVEGEPPAKVTWYFKGQDQSKKEGVTVSNPDYSTSIVIDNAQRSQSGMYLIR